MEQATAGRVALKAGWLNDDWANMSYSTQNNMGGSLTGGTTRTSGTTYVGNCIPYDYYPWYRQYSYPVYVSSPARPIKLKLSEIDRLRKAAKADKALKLILDKFTSQIEITVDFE